MNPRQVELALRKQKLQLRAEAQRADITQRLAGIDGALDRVDSLRDHLAWAKDKIPVLSVALIVVLAAIPLLRGLLALVRRRLEPAAGSGSAPPRRRRTG